MASFYNGLASTATKLLKDKGRSVTFTRDVEASFVPATGISTPAASTTYTAYGAAFDYTAMEIANSTIEAGDIRFMMESGTEPAIADTCVIDSVTYRVMNVRATKPAGVALYFEAQLRK